ncbi:RNA polymerase sigma factor [Desertivirga arenae]|uniref:RNA polymerase sigma factor n=1 Tax=Desertivirga arenae TaxID=2810309 RepID=UPI001A95C83C|nr:RNA polymerase sigma-70 factor [Pedobacter sp. SYSU D00823]
MISHEEDIALKRICAGDSNAFSEFYRKHFNLVKLFILRYVKDPDVAEDLVQEVFIKLWDNRSNLGEVRSLKDYLFIISRNYTFNFLKKVSADQAMKEKIILFASTTSINAEDKVVSEEYYAHLQKVLSSLPPQTQQIFRMCREEEKSYQEVSALLGISKDAVKKHMVRSLKALKLTLQNSLDIFLFLIINTLR